MLPDIISAGAIQDVSVKPYQPRQAADTGMPDGLPPRRPDTRRIQDAAKAYGVNGAANRTPDAQKVVQPDPKSQKDQVELQFALTPDEKTAFSRYAASREEGKEGESAFISEEDRERMREATERIAAAMEERIAKSDQSRQRMERVMSEWYSILAGDDRDAKTDPFAFIGILRSAAMGKYEFEP